MEITSGLSQAVAQNRLLQNGPNQLPEAKSPGLLKIFVRQFKSPFIYVLLVAAVVSLGLGQTGSVRSEKNGAASCYGIT